MRQLVQEHPSDVLARGDKVDRKTLAIKQGTADNFLTW